ncbi:MAG: GFA family protein [Acidiferrobacterales bacterium]
MTATGGCLCGAIRFEVTEAPYQTDYCYCRMCQRSSGSVLTSWADFKETEFHCTRGEITYYKSSQYARRGFCASCGSTLIQRPLGGDWVAVATGSFDQPEEFPPRGVHCGTESQVPWLKIDDDLPRKTTRETMGYEVES